jgi:carbonic anhydrase/acetyltransferase-like protein (isoleucine patch superfamily)
LDPSRPLILAHGGIAPTVGEGVFLAPGSTIIGDVVIGPRASVWFGTVVRGDVHRIRVGAETNIQDGCMLHVTGGTHPLTIDERVTVGHGVILHGCTIGEGAMIGMGAVVMDGAVIGQGSLVGAGSLVPPGAKIPPGVLVLGAPAKPARALTEEERAGFLESAAHYVAYAARYREELGRGSDRAE